MNSDEVTLTLEAPETAMAPPLPGWATFDMKEELVMLCEVLEVEYIPLPNDALFPTNKDDEDHCVVLVDSEKAPPPNPSVAELLKRML